MFAAESRDKPRPKDGGARTTTPKAVLHRKSLDVLGEALEAADYR